MIPTSIVIWLCAAALFSFALPIGTLIWWRRTRRAKLTPFFAGALVFVVFALVLEPMLHRVCVMGDNAVARAINANPYLYMLYGALAAGVFEETGRYAAFRLLLHKRRFPERDTAVIYGVGHGGIETMVLLGVTYGLYAALALLLRGGNYSAALALAGGEAGDVAMMLGRLGQITPGVCVFAMIERVSAFLLQIALSCFVFLAARDRTQRSWFPFAIALHAIANMPAALYQRGMLPLWATELWLAVFALYALRSARKCYLELMDP